MGSCGLVLKQENNKTRLCFNISSVTKWGVDCVRVIRRFRKNFRELVLLSDEILKEIKSIE